MSFTGIQAIGTNAGQWPSLLLRAGATIFAGALLVAPAQSTSASVREAVRNQRPATQSNAGFLVVQRERRRIADGLSDLRRLGGFTWEQVARLFKVSRRSVHFWASGEAMSVEHEEHLNRLLASVIRISRGGADQTRSVITSPSQDGRIPFDLLAQREYDEAVALASHGADGAIVKRAPVVPERPSEWRPQFVEGALPDFVDVSGAPRASARSRTRRGLG